jgi:hypothetical protein
MPRVAIDKSSKLNTEKISTDCMPGLYSIDSIHMAKDGFTEIQQKLEAIALELKNENNPDRRRTLLKEMSRLLAEAQRITSQPPKP